jgi:hypothetical protein
MARHPNPKRVKLHRTYTVPEAAACLGVHRNTIRRYLRNGLSPTDKKRPVLILGAVLRQFLEERRAAGRQSCQPGEMYCLRCKGPRRPAGDMADYIPMTAATGNLRAMCADCELLMHRRVALANLRAVMPGIEITIQQPSLRIEECEEACGDCDLEGVKLP